MPRTPEQVKADEALTEAIDSVWRAYDQDDDPGILVDYIVIGTRRHFDDDGNGTTSVGSFNRDDGVPIYAQLGMVEFTAARLRRYASGDSDD